MESLTGIWVNFFTAAGIPSDVGATYAITFTENRIQSDMLLDLNKEYLRDMGITRMGDVIAILRHAKTVHESTARERVLNTATPKVPIAAVSAQTNQAKSSSPMTRILEHYTRKLPNSEAPETQTAGNLKRKIIQPSSNAIDDAKKARHMEVKNTIATRSNIGAFNKKTVFSRLGESSEYIKTEAAMIEADGAGKTIFSRLGSKNITVNVNDSHRSVQQEESGQPLQYEGILKNYSEMRNATLKVTPLANKEVRKTITFGTMRADQAPVSAKQKLALPKMKSVKFSNHIEFKEIEAAPKRVIFHNMSKTEPSIRNDNPVFNKPERRLSLPSRLPTYEVKSRLGTKQIQIQPIAKPMQSHNKEHIQRNVFTRLGNTRQS